ncbi:MAG: hypothetical protein Tsb0021_09190 [Chlamydiales bacterium]
MSIPFNDHLKWDVYTSNPNWHGSLSAPAPSIDQEDVVRQAVQTLFVQTFKQTGVRGVQFVRDAARLVLKVPIRSALTPIVLPKNWKQRERAKINAKLAGYSFVQLVSVPAKFLVALTALAAAAISYEKAKWLLDHSEYCTAYLDGRASQLEALKEEGRKYASNKEEYNNYKNWLYSINPLLCSKQDH